MRVPARVERRARGLQIGELREYLFGVRSRAAAVAVLAVLVWPWGPRTADAANGTHVRTPVVWPERACIEYIDRSVDPVYVLDYDIPQEDTDVTADEVDQSRTHQFFAFCRQHSAQDYLPLWITPDDVADATRMSLITQPIDEDEILESSTDWAGCWHRITEDEDRRPITYAMADEDIPWDTTGIPVGVYVIQGYTYEPATNLWMEHENHVVRVFDGGDPAVTGPAATASASDDLVPCAGSTFEITSCVSALPGTTATAEYALTTGPGSEQPDYQLTWKPLATVPVEGDTLTIPVTLPDDTGEETIVLRVRFVDPNDAEYVAYRPGAYVVLARGLCGDVDECDAGFIQDPSCNTSSAADGSGTDDDGAAAGSGSEAEASETSSGPGAKDDGGTGCTCNGTRPSLASAVMLGLVVTVRRRRRRRA